MPHSPFVTAHTVQITVEPEVTSKSSCSGCQVHVYVGRQQVDGGPLIARLQDAAEGRYGLLETVTIVPVIRQGEAARR